MSYKISQVEKKLQDGIPLVVSEAALLLGVSREKVTRWVQQGLLQGMPGGRPLRVSAASVLEMRKPVAAEVALPERFHKNWFRLPGV